MIEAIGIVGAACFALCAAPTAWLAYKNGNTPLDWGLLTIWLIGEILTMLYVAATSMDLILMGNYTTNLALLLVIIRYKACPREIK